MNGLLAWLMENTGRGILVLLGGLFFSAIFNLQAQKYPVKNPDFHFLTKFKPDTAPTFFSEGLSSPIVKPINQYLMGWYDSEAYIDYGGHTSFKSFEEYRQYVGPVNTIITTHNHLLTENRYKRLIKTLTPDQPPLQFIVRLSVKNDKRFISAENEEDVRILKKDIISVLQNYGGSSEIIRGWLTIDEPEPHRISYEEFKSYNSAIRRAERDLGILHKPILLTTRNMVKKYGADPNVDAIGYENYFFRDSYPHFEEKILNLPQMLDSIRAYFPNKMVYAIPQGFGHKCCGNETEAFYKDNWNRVPSYAEYRYQIFASLMRGATGFFPWAARIAYHPNQDYHGQSGPNQEFWDFHLKSGDRDEFYKNEERQLFGNLKEVFEELKEVSTWLIEGSFIDSLCSTNQPRKDLRTLFLKRDKDFLLIAANEKNNTGRILESNAVRFFLDRNNGTFDGYSIREVSPHQYDQGAHFDSLIPHQSVQVHLKSEIRGFFHFDSFFEPGEVKIYLFSRG
ncbi:MAG: hypothetical protein KDD63_00505 [Bacteroidetes bacterium]|nr:hypothetical protein [Bacteroidota bacterium]